MAVAAELLNPSPTVSMATRPLRVCHVSLTLKTGVDQFNKLTGKTCRVLVGHQLQYDLRDGFPALTTRK